MDFLTEFDPETRDSVDLQVIGARPLMPESLIQAYLHSDYGVEATTSVRLRIGSRSSQLDAQFNEHDFHAGILMSARNPRSQLLTDDENSDRHEELLRLCKDHGIASLPAWGEDRDKQFPREDSLLLLNVTQHEAQLIARQFSQWAYVSVAPGRAAKLFVECLDGCYRPHI